MISPGMGVLERCRRDGQARSGGVGGKRAKTGKRLCALVLMINPPTEYSRIRKCIVLACIRDQNWD
jgi:hypothetical protein